MIGPSAPLLELAEADARKPLLVTSPASAAILNGAGEFRLVRETRGAEIDWGGVYAQGVRLTGPWRTAIETEEKTYRLLDSLTRLVATRWHVESEHRLGTLSLAQEVTALANPPGVLRRFRFTGERSELVRLETGFSPFLLPVLVEGVKPYLFRAETHGPSLQVTQHGFAGVVDSDPLPDHLSVNGAEWIGGRHEGEIEDVGIAHEFRVEPGLATEIRWFIWGGLERTVLANPTAGERVFPASPEARPRLEAAWRAWEAGTPTFRFPDAPWLEAAYDRARGALRSLYARPTDDITGVYAGFPWYAALWCRDMAWCLGAVLWLGDHDWVEASLASVFRFQSRRSIPLLGARPGELPMQIAPGPIFLYGTSDSSLYYPALVRQAARHSGRLGLARELFPALDRVATWGFEKSNGRTYLLTNGGEVRTMALAAQAVGRIHYGIDAPDTTIWDSADRRDHAVDVQVLWILMLRAIEELAERTEQPASRRNQDAARQVTKLLETAYRWDAQHFLYDSLLHDGTPVPKLRPNALRAVSAGLLPPAVAAGVVGRVTRPDLTTDWGVRTLSSEDPNYDPALYHEGQVWPIATAWAADAAFAVGRSELGLRYLRMLARMLEAEHGFANECYRGDRAEPFNSCFLLGFSVAPFLTTLFERLFGLEPDGAVPSLLVRPSFPPGWRSASVDGIRLAEGTVRLDWEKGILRVAWTGARSLVVRSTAGEVSVPPRGAATLSAPLPSAI